MSQTETKTCPNCNIEVVAGDAFCGSCGQQLRWCPNCGTPARAGATFCSACGTAIDAQQSPSRGTDKPATQADPAEQTPAAQPPPTQAPPRPVTGAVLRPTSPTGLIAGMAIAVATFLPWLADPSGINFNAYDLPITSLYDQDGGDTAFKVGHLVVALGVALALLSFNARTATLRRALAVVTLVVALAYGANLMGALGGTDASVTDYYGFGAWITLAAAGFATWKP